MDTVTHAMMGAIVASPCLESRPIVASAFVFGSVIPDLDVLSRVFGRRAFLDSHQTYSHALPVLAALGALCFAALSLTCAPVDALGVSVALVLGMAFHTALDYTNTYGITLFAPFSRRRSCREWVFFIDAFVIASCIVVLAILVWRMAQGQPLGHGLQLGWLGVMVAYWALHVWLRRRALHACPPNTLALLPSSLVSWRFFGCSREGDTVHTFRVDARTGKRDREACVPVLDAQDQDVLDRVPEFAAMRRLSPAYHLVERNRSGDTRTLLCRDLRVRNFDTTFGNLEVVVDDEGRILERTFHV